VKIFHFDSVDSLLLNRDADAAQQNLADDDAAQIGAAKNLNSLIRLFLVELFVNLEQEYLNSYSILFNVVRIMIMFQVFVMLYTDERNGQTTVTPTSK